MAGLELFSNQASTTVSSGGTTAPAAGTVQTWTVASSTGFPAASNTAVPPTFFRITDPASSTEKMIVTNVSGTTWTVTRGAEGTNPVAHSSGFTVQNVIDAAALNLFSQATQIIVQPTGDTTGVADQAAMQAALESLPANGTLILAGGTYYLNAPVLYENGQSVVGLGFSKGYSVGATAYVQQASGANMVPPGTPALNNRGLWISGTAYALHDAVLLPVMPGPLFYTSANSRGNFAASTSYAVNDVVRNVTADNLAYICISAYTSSATTPNNDGTHWQQVATQLYYCTTALTSTTTPDVDTSHWAAVGSTGLFAAWDWATNSGSDGGPSQFRNIQFDGNVSQNPFSTCSGIVLMNYWSSIRECTFRDMPMHGVYLTDQAIGASPLASAGSENSITECKFYNIGQNAIRSFSGNSGNNEDGFIRDCLISGTGLDAISIDCLGGWSISGCHLYGIGGNGINGRVGFATKIIDNYIEDFGGQNAATYYAGIGITQVNGRASHISRNLVGSNDKSVNASHYQLIAVTAGSGETDAAAIVTDNAIVGNSGSPFNSLGLVLQYNSGGVLTVTADNNQIQNVVTPLYYQTGVNLNDFAEDVTRLLPSGDASGVTDAAIINGALANLPAGVGTIHLAAGLWYVECGQVSVDRSGVYFEGEGKWSTYVLGVGAGDVFRMLDSSTYGSRVIFGGGFKGMTVDGVNTTGNAVGIHVGDIFQLEFDVAVGNFNAGSSSVAVKFDNVWAISEQMQGLIYAFNSTTNVMFAQTPGVSNTFCYGSFERANLTICIDQVSASFDGITIRDGTYLNNSDLRVFGNFGGTNSGAVTSAVFKITGSTPSGSQDGAPGAIPSNLFKCFVDVGVECAGGFTFTPTTFSLSGSCYAGNLFGNLYFGASGNTFTSTTAVIGFFGFTDGDPALVAQSTQAWLFQGQLGTGTYATATVLASSGTISASASWAIVAPTASVTGVIIASGTYDGQFLTVFNDSAFTVTFAATATSHVASGVNEFITPNTMRFYQWSTVFGSWFPVGKPTDAIPSAEQFVELTTPYTLASGTALQKLFNATTNGTITVQAATTYFFECDFDLATMATGSGNFSFGFGGTATLTSVKYMAWSVKAANLTTPVAPQVVMGTAATALALVSNTSTSQQTGMARIRGTIRVNAAGTLIPQVALGVSTTTAAVGTNSYFRLRPVGSNTVTTVGNWT